MPQTFLNRSLAVATAATFALAPALADTLYDDFKTKWRPVQFGTGAATSMVRNRLEITLEAVAAGSGQDFFGSGLFSTCALKGDFDLRASYRLLDWPEHNGTRVALFLGSMADLPTDNGIFIERDSYSEADADVPFDLYVFFAEQGVQLIEHETDHQSGLLRLRRVGPVVTGYYKSDSDWVEMGSTNLGTQSLRFAVVTYSHDSVFADANVRASFEGVRLAAGSFTGATCPVSTP